MAETRLKIAVFIDFDNIEIGVKSTLGQHFDVGAVLEAIKERGEVVTKIAYGDWTRAGDYSRSLTQHAIHMVQRNLTPGGDKNGADINLALDALEMAFTHSHINAFVIVGGDSDFMALVEKLKQYDRKVFVVGGRAFTSVILQKNCTEFIAYENLVNVVSAMPRKAGARAKAEAPVTQAVALVRRALKVLSDREVSPQLGVLKSTLLQLDSTFSEREYGASTFRDFVQRLARAGYVTLKGTDRNIYVELREGGDGTASGGVAALPASGGKDGEATAGDGGDGASGAIDGDPLPGSAVSSVGLNSPGVSSSGGSGAAGVGTSSEASGRGGSSADAGTSVSSGSGAFATTGAAAPNGAVSHQTTTVATPDGGVTENVGAPNLSTASAVSAQAEGVRFITEVFQRPGLVSRWPLYLRQVKQILRNVDETFDERRYGFQGLVEALRYCQREGLFRLDRDRQGVLRVYPGPTLPRAVASPGQSLEAATPQALTETVEPRDASEARQEVVAGAASSDNLSSGLPDTAVGAMHERSEPESAANQSLAATTTASASDDSAREAAPAVLEGTVESAPTRRPSRRRPGATAAKPTTKKAAAAPKARGVKVARPRKSA